MPTIQSHEFLQKWYAEFKKQVYEKAQIDMTQKADLGRLKNYTPTNWTLSNLFDAEGELMYACIPHNGVEYHNPPPDIFPPKQEAPANNPPAKGKKKGAQQPQAPEVDEDEMRVDAYMQWAQDNQQLPESDEDIERLYNMSREGTLMAIDPGYAFHAMRQVYTNEKGEVSVSIPAKDMISEKENGPEDHKIPHAPDAFPEMPDPKEFGLTPAPQPPKAPKNMKPGFWSWVGYMLWMDTDYAKKERYKKDLATYNTEYSEWKEKQPEAYASYEAATEEVMRQQSEYFREAEEYFAKPLGKLFAIKISMNNQAWRTEGDLPRGKDGHTAPRRLREKELNFWRKQHADLPQGKTNEALEEARKIIKYAKNTKNVVANLLGHDAEPSVLEDWIKRGVFKDHTYKLKRYNLPRLDEDYVATRERRIEFGDIWTNLFQVAGLAAISHPDVLGGEIYGSEKLDRVLTADERAKLNYTFVLQNLITEGRPPADEYMKYLEPARAKANDAIQAYYEGEVGPMAELLRGAIRKTNQQATSLLVAHSPHAMNTLYLIGRMWDVVQADPQLQAKVGLTLEEIEETKGNIAIHSVMTKGFQAKEKLLMHALYQHTLSEQELREYSCDLMLAQQVEKRVFAEHDEIDAKIAETEEFAEAAELMGRGDAESTKIGGWRYELIKRPGFEVGKDLLKENWIESARAAIMEQCHLDRITTMTPDEIGRVVSSPSEFEKTFKQQAPRQEGREAVQEIVPARNHEAQPNVLH